VGLKRITVIMSLAVAASFLWGFFAHRNKTFPYALLRSAAMQAGVVEADSTLARERRADVQPKTAPLTALKTLPYVQSSFDPASESRGVLIFNSTKAQPGVNFYSQQGHNRAYLLDMQGNVLHEWSYRYPAPANWHNAELLGDGSLLVVVENYALFKIDRCSQLVWSYEARAHHGVSVDGQGSIYGARWELVDAEDARSAAAVLDERITILTAEGVQKDELSVMELLRDSPYEFLIPTVADGTFADGAELDLIHLNHVEVFDGRLRHLSPLFEAGNLLISMRNLNAIAIVSGRSRRIIWLWGPNSLALQHHAQLLPSGHILLFDNGTESSRVVELDPIRNEIVWTYERGTDFFSSWGGSVQRLPNGNTLITETSSGYVTEVTRDGDVVWRFANPDVDEEGQRSNIWRMSRFLPGELPFLAEDGCSQSEGAAGNEGRDERRER
jgi:hypothetical protein